MMKLLLSHLYLLKGYSKSSIVTDRINEQPLIIDIFHETPYHHSI
jgi:hypothetical protein